MSRFGPDPQAFFASVYMGIPPWEIGGVQPALTELFAAYPPTSPVLDVGCGSGDLVLALAQGGLEVVGIDFVETAIEQARAKAQALPQDVAQRATFEVGDGLQPSLLQRRFATVVDCGFLHLFEHEKRKRYIADLAATIAPGGRYYLLAFAIEFPVANVPLPVSETELRTAFLPEEGWAIRTICPAEFLSRVAAPTPAISACIERTA